jgi:hypothetical protein
MLFGQALKSMVQPNPIESVPFWLTARAERPGNAVVLKNGLRLTRHTTKMPVDAARRKP